MIRAALICQAFTLIMLLYSPTARAADLVVNSTADEVTDDSSCTLREAVLAANSDADGNGCVASGAYGDDRIVFAVGGLIYVIGELEVTNHLTIDGGGNVTLDAAHVNRLFAVRDPLAQARGTASSIRFRLDGLTLQNGRTGGSQVLFGAPPIDLGNNSARGGCIFHYGGEASLLQIEDSVVRGCEIIAGSDSPSEGGAVFMATGSIGLPDDATPPRLVLRRSEFSDNVARADQTARGGAVATAGRGSIEVEIEDVRLTGNRAEAEQSAAGGGAFLRANALRILRTEVTFNEAKVAAVETRASARGGGLALELDASTAEIANVTLARNVALATAALVVRGAIDVEPLAEGGGLFAEFLDASLIARGATALVLNNLTLIENRSDGPGGAEASAGGIGIAGDSSIPGVVELANTILASNTVDGLLENCRPGDPLNSLGHNLIDINCGISPGVGDRIGVLPMLEDVAENGGAVPGMLSALPMLNSPALDAGNPGPVQPAGGVGACRPFDQRGKARPLSVVGGAVCDIGAVELESPFPTAGEVQSIPTLRLTGLLILALIVAAFAAVRFTAMGAQS